MDHFQQSAVAHQWHLSEGSSDTSDIASSTIPAESTVSTAVAYPLYDAANEHDACGTGFVAHLAGRRDHSIVQNALQALTNLAHRGAMDATGESSDGIGMMTHIPSTLIQHWLTNNNLPDVPETELALAMCFFPHDPIQRHTAHDIVQNIVQRRGMRIVGWRIVPIHLQALGQQAQGTCPFIEQAIICHHERAATIERTLYLTRKECEAHLALESLGCYFPSFSTQVVVYKALATAEQLPRFYTDLTDPQFVSGFAIFHQRYSTNTFPSWPLAQPMRFLAHNGEINTIQGNRNWMKIREITSVEQCWKHESRYVRPICEEQGSDSTNLDNVLELLIHSGRDLLHSLAMLIPESWEQNDQCPPAVQAFYQAHASQMEPWDGPAALVFSDGRTIGASLDRNGLRPLRYIVTADDLIIAASEVGVIDIGDIPVVRKGRLGPGELLAVDMVTGQVYENAHIKQRLAAQHPYTAWNARHICTIAPSDHLKVPQPPSPQELMRLHMLFGYSHEDVEMTIKPMVNDSIEPLWSMGDDTPLSLLSEQPRPLSTYFRQFFAQVTNPPIDSLRERSVMSLTTYIGNRGNELLNTEPAAKLIRLDSPIVNTPQFLATMLTIARQKMHSVRLSLGYRVASSSLQTALEQLETTAVNAVQKGAAVIVLSDRDLANGDAPLPMPLAIAAVHHALMRNGLRLRVGIIVETGSAWDTHQVALLFGFGANVVYPYLALATALTCAKADESGDKLAAAELEQHYCHSLEKGLLKIMARMGLSVLESYQGAQLFEILGVNRDIVNRFFPDTPSSLGGLALEDIHLQIVEHYAAAADYQQSLANTNAEGIKPTQRIKLPDRGYVRFRKNAEYHAANPSVVRALQKAAISGERADYTMYTDLVHQRPPTALRDLLEFRMAQPIPIEEVEPVSAITQRFISTAMSLGALGPEAHLTLTLGAHMVGARSNTGEGGEDVPLYTATRDGVSTNCKIKQIASGRFGVTTSYLVHAEEIEIKMTQGSKPGEGGQIPARKVTDLIARLRHTMPGISLISPPPHHDIYSIEDLAQLIFDMKQVNPRAAVGVKLVAERGVGTVAAGVAKAHADYVLISGHDGGTGASPLTSIKHAGNPWELGLVEAQQVLRMNGLRSRVRLRTDGGLKTGRDVVIAALLGADEYGFGTAALIAMGCDMARQCHLDTCPAGIATQREDLRKKFTGKPEHVANYFTFVAEEIREILASLGARSLDDIIGRVDMLQVRSFPADSALQARIATMHLDELLASGHADKPRRYMPAERTVAKSDDAEAAILQDAIPLLDRGYDVLLHTAIHNRDRTVGARLAGEITTRYGENGLPSGSITVHYTGSAGQSFGAFSVHGMRLILEGDANDYVAKGMSGGEIVISPKPRIGYHAHDNAIAGNAVLYGATGGKLFLHGRAGERFAVRNSGAIAVVEGIGDHGCEYMTSGKVVVLGPVGKNFGAGMSGGVAYIFDPTNTFKRHLNDDMIVAERLAVQGRNPEIIDVLTRYVTLTGSSVASKILREWEDLGGLFWRVLPKSLPDRLHDLPSSAPASSYAGSMGSGSSMAVFL